MTLKRDDILAALPKKGFAINRQSHHIFLHFYFRGKETSIFTKISHGTSYNEIGDPLLGMMAKQLKLKKAEFVDLVKCSLSQDKYLAKLLEAGLEL